MLKEKQKDHDIRIMEEAIGIVENHYDNNSISGDGRVEYIRFRMAHIKDGVKIFRESDGRNRDVCSSLSNLFTSFCNEMSENTEIDWVIWTDIRDELTRMTIDG